MSMLRFIKNWTLSFSMLTGAAAYFLYVNLHFLDGTHAAVGTALEYIQPLLIFCMLFISFCRVSVRELKPRAWMLKMLAIQSISFVLMGLMLIVMHDASEQTRSIVESAMICMICPTATAASVVTSRLLGNPNTVVSYTCLINLTASLLVPAVVPFLHEGAHAGMDFETSFLLIIGKVFPLLIMPLLAAWLARHLFPRFHRAVLRRKNLAFNLWAVSLALAIGITVKAIVHSGVGVWTLAGIAAVSLIACIFQFICGRIIGCHHVEPIAGAQSLGQKNTVFAIWMGYTFLHPATALAGGFYSVWHNIVNSWQLHRQRGRG
ncbi:MAG: transporter [Prevotellaceae bacterium]|nr:transporter [Prevotellaceae bacterium]